MPGALLQNASYSNRTKSLEMESQQFIEMSKRMRKRETEKKKRRENISYANVGTIQPKGHKMLLSSAMLLIRKCNAKIQTI